MEEEASNEVEVQPSVPSGVGYSQNWPSSTTSVLTGRGLDEPHVELLFVQS